VIYLDTCALTKLIRPEPETDALHQWLRESDDPWVGSVLIEVELIRVVRRVCPATLPAAILLLGGMDIMPLDEQIVARAQQLVDPGLRSLDAIHLASALEIGAVSAFVTYDQRLLKAAEDHGLPAVAPRVAAAT
jgi:hypothetical protein